MTLDRSKLRRVTRELKAAKEECPNAEAELLIRLLEFMLRMNKDEATAYYNAATKA